jgi:hypothetical protein
MIDQMSNDVTMLQETGQNVMQSWKNYGSQYMKSIEAEYIGTQKHTFYYISLMVRHFIQLPHKFL